MATETTFDELVRNGNPTRLRVRIGGLLGEIDASLGTDYRLRFLTEAATCESWLDLVRVSHAHASKVLAADLSINHDADYYLSRSA